MSELGTLSPLHHFDLADGRFAGTSPADMANMFEQLEQHPNCDRLVLHVHGGLVSRPSGLATARRLMGWYQAAGAYPVFAIWRSGVAEAIGNNLSEIAQEPIFRRLLRRVAQAVAGHLASGLDDRGAGIALRPLDDFPDDTIALERKLDDIAARRPRPSAATDADAELSTRARNNLEAEFARDPILKQETARIANGFKTPAEIAADLDSRGTVALGSRASLISPHVIRRIQKDAPDQDSRAIFTSLMVAKLAVTACVGVVRRWWTGRDHGLYCTVIEEVLRQFYIDNAGGLVWKLMRNDCADAFRPDASLHGGTALVEHLADYLRTDRRLILVGHSAGAIFLCHLLSSLHKRVPTARVEVIFLAPACSFNILRDTIELCADSIEHFRMFGMLDDLERRDWLVPVLYRGSLLYLVSGILEDQVDAPLVGMERYFLLSPEVLATDEPAVNRVKNFIAKKDREAVWSIMSGVKGRESRADKHGAFDDDPTTLESLRHLIAHGSAS